MADYRSWDDFDVIYPPTDNIGIAESGHPSDEDGILQAREPNTLDLHFIEFGLQTNAEITWWKSIEPGRV
jgi:hypothetical protein